ncbi:MAG: hypothetical protein Q8K81_02455 [Sulfuricurvum sp.]|nr:hypothetical protein [Sulfuricurvum sp.]
MPRFPIILLSSLIALAAYAEELPKMEFKEQSALKMTTSNETREQHTRWLPIISPSGQEVPKESAALPSKPMGELIKTQIQKKIQILLKPINDDGQN